MTPTRPRSNPDYKLQRRLAMLQADRRIAAATAVVAARSPGLVDDLPLAERVRNVLGIIYGAVVEVAFSATRSADLAAEGYAELKRVLASIVEDER